MTIADIDREELRRAGQKMRGYFPDTGPYRRELYVKHLAFFAAGQQQRERCCLAERADRAVPNTASLHGNHGCERFLLAVACRRASREAARRCSKSLTSF